MHCKRLGIFEDVWPENGGPLPWRLTRPQRLFLDDRMRRTLWPHYMERLYYRGASFWQKPGHMWKARRKYRLLLYILPTQLRDQVPAFRDFLLFFTWCLRRLAGQVCSYDYARQVLGILPGSRFVIKGLVKSIQRDMTRALGLMEGCVPIDFLKPILHHFAHYADFTSTHGILEIL